MDPQKPTPTPPLSFTIAPSLAAYDVSVTDFLRTHACARLVVSSAVFHPASLTPGSQPRLLLVQRAAHDACPEFWEIPGGSADALPGVGVVAEAARELWEECGLRAAAATALVGTYTWVDGGEVWRKVTFLFEVERKGTADGDDDVEVVLDPEEHQAYVWATEEEAKAGECGDVEIRWTFPAQKDNVLKAFDVLRQRVLEER